MNFENYDFVNSKNFTGKIIITSFPGLNENKIFSIDYFLKEKGYLVDVYEPILDKQNLDFGIFDKEKEDNKRKSDFFKLTAPELSALSVLGLSPPVIIKELKSKYKELVKLYHPDTNGGRKSAEEKLKSINRAYETLIQLTNS